MRKDIKSLTLPEAEEILKHVYGSRKDDQVYDISFTNKLNPDGSEKVTFSIQPVIGILYYTGINSDRAVLPFHHLKVIDWLYDHGYEVSDLLKQTFDLIEMEYNLGELAFHMHFLINHSIHKDKFAEELRTIIEGYLSKYWYDSE